MENSKDSIEVLVKDIKLPFVSVLRLSLQILVVQTILTVILGAGLTILNLLVGR